MHAPSPLTPCLCSPGVNDQLLGAQSSSRTSSNNSPHDLESDLVRFFLRVIIFVNVFAIMFGNVSDVDYFLTGIESKLFARQTGR